MIGCRLARMRIGEGMDEHVDARLGCKLVGPVDWYEDGTSSLSVRQQGADENCVACGRNADDVGVRNAIANRILRVNFGEGLREMQRELCRKIGDGVNQAADLISATASI